MQSSSRPQARSLLRSTTAFTGALLLAACASTPPAPTASLTGARTAISNAERADAGHFAAGELTEARSKLASADSAVADKQMIRAERLADQSRVEAELASARTSATKAKAVNDDMLRSNDTVVEEMKRNEGSKP